MENETKPINQKQYERRMYLHQRQQSAKRDTN